MKGVSPRYTLTIKLEVCVAQENMRWNENNDYMSFFGFTDGISTVTEMLWRHLYWFLNLQCAIVMLYCILFCRPSILYLHIWHHRNAQGCHRGTQSVRYSQKGIHLRCCTVNDRCLTISPVIPQQLLQNCCFWVFCLSHEPRWHHLWLPATLSLSRYCIWWQALALDEYSFLF